MNAIDERIGYSKLLTARVLGSLSKEKKNTLEQWELIGTNKEVSKDILNAQNFSNWERKKKEIDTQEEWRAFLLRMEDSTKKSTKVRRLNAIKWMSAIAAIMVIGFFSYNFFTSSDNQFQTLDNVTIAPGSSRAELVLSTGEVVSLEETQGSTIQEGQMAIANDKGVLEYTDATNANKTEAKTNILRVPRGAEYQLVLADGTKVWLNSDTELTYTVPFVGNERRVSLKGEAYFEVSPNKELPFIVATVNQEVQVLGTSFNVSSYSEEASEVTTLVEGKVLVSSDSNKEKMYLDPNEQTIFNKQNASMKKTSVDVYSYIAWKEGRFVFNNVTFEDFLSKVARWYNVDIIYHTNSVKKLRFTGDLPRYSDMTSILKILEEEMSVTINVEGNRNIHVYSK